MPQQITSTELITYRDRVQSGGLSEAIKVYGELSAKGYNYAGWGEGVATGSTIAGASALDYLSSTALMGIDINSCRNLSSRPCKIPERASLSGLSQKISD